MTVPFDRLRADLRRRRAERLGLPEGEFAAPDPASPALLGRRYEVRERLGEGAVAIVYRGLDRDLGRPVAIKMLRDSLLLHETARGRFLLEARMLARMDHPGIVKVHDVGDDEGRLYLILELVEGASLADVLDRGDPDRGLPWALRALAETARAVHHAHEKGVIHRDLKPQNILVTGAGDPKVADFGLARLAEPAPSLTRTGAVLGTPLYMSPEQVRGDSEAITARTDVYALGAILYRVAGGRPPHAATSVVELYDRIAKEDPAPLRKVQPDAAWQLEAIARKSLEKDPARRYPSAEAFAADLEAHLRGDPIVARPLPAVVRAGRAIRRHRIGALALAGAVFVAAAGTVLGLRRETEDRARAKALVLLESARPPLERVTAALYRGQADFEPLHRALAEARLRTEEAIRLSPDLPLAPHRRGEILELQGFFDEAEASWRRAAELDPAFGAARYRLGRLLLWRAYLATTPLWEDPRNERRALAEGLAREGADHLARAGTAVTGFDGDLQHRAATAMLLYLKEDRPAARAACATGIRDFAGKEGVEEFHWLTALLEETPAARISALDRAVALKPGYALALYVRAEAKNQAGDQAGVFADYDRALQVSPDFAEARLYRGACLYRMERGKEAIADFDYLIRRGALLSAAYNGRGSTHLDRLGDPDRAIADLDEAIRLQPENYALPYIARGRAYLKKRDFKAAAADLTRATEIVPWPAVRADRMTARLMAGDRDGAIEDLKALRPAGWTVPVLERELDHLREEFEKKAGR